MSTAFHAADWAHRLRESGPRESGEAVARAVSNARVDVNPHQVDAAVFALRSPLSTGVLRADEVGLGKTIEAGLLIAQSWAERRRRIIVLVPASLRTQWADELTRKFMLPTELIEGTSRRKALEAGEANYEPDFVVETHTMRCIVEAKAAHQMTDPTVLAKQRAADTGCEHVSKYVQTHGGKPWKCCSCPTGRSRRR
jgi:hypothetical protein